APEVTGIAVEEAPSAGPSVIPVSALRSRLDTAGEAGSWQVVAGLDTLPAGEVGAVTVAGLPVVAVRIGSELYAYRDRCPACGTGLAGSAALDAEVLACAACRQRFDVRLAGRGLDRPELHLVPLPLLADDGRVRLAVGSGAGA
ncbi:MAG TPA: Rieske 2Fe-2S domain-containing protein, partial [Actinomycetota bacterium]|nr:Rieske 2Fe-2S domain-containing protein [Actinomycetota bacterium]